jgi:hypothetical protein
VSEQYPTLAAGQRITASLLRSMLPQFARKTADTARSAVTTQTDDPHLTFTVEANAVYDCSGWLKYDGPTAADFQFSWTIPSGADGEFYGWGAGHSPVISFNNAGTTLLDTSSSRGYPIRVESLDITSASRNVGCLGVGTLMTVQTRALLRVGSTGGTFALKWGQATSDASAVTVYTDSVLRLDRIA